MSDTAWVAVAFVLFILLLWKLKVPAAINTALDERGARIKAELEEAARLREEAQALFAEYQRKQKAALKDAEDIVAAARAEAKAIAAQAEIDLKAALARRQAQAEAKIAQAETQALAEVRSAAVDIAVEAARMVLAKQAGNQAAMDAAITEVRSFVH